MALRQQYDKPIFDDLEIWLKEQLDKISGKTPLAKAIRYALARMPKARAYLDNGFLELDNNTAERAVRPIAVGRKNYLFMGLGSQVGFIRPKTAPVVCVPQNAHRTSSPKAEQSLGC